MSNKYETVERSEQPLNSKSNIIDQMKSVQAENSQLSLLLELTNKILMEYQVKYGNILYEEIKSKHQYTTESDFEYKKKYLIENFGLIRDYEEELLEKEKLIEALNEEIKSYGESLQGLIASEKKSNDELLKCQEEKQRLISEVLKPGGSGALSKTYNVNNTTGFNSGFNTGLGGIQLGPSSEDMKKYNFIMEQQKEELLSTIEKYKSENEQLRMISKSLNDKNTELEEAYNNINRDYTIYKQENEDFHCLRNSMIIKFKNYNEEMLKLETEVEKYKEVVKKTSSEENLIRKELDFYKENYDDLEHRKNNEIEALIREITNLRANLNDERMRLSVIEEDNSDKKFELSKYKQELAMVKEDCLHLNKMLESANKVVKSVQDKEKTLDIILKTSKSKLDTSQIDKEKALLKVKLLEQQNNRIHTDHSKMTNERQEKYENFLNAVQSKYMLITDQKEEELKRLRNEVLTLKINNDKLFNDYSLVKREYDRFGSIFTEECDKLLKKYSDSEKNALRIQESLIDKNCELSKKLEKSEFSRQILEKEIRLYVDNDRNKDLIINKISKVDDVKDKEYLKIKEKYELVVIEKEEIEKELERERAIYQTKLYNLKNQSDMKLGILESTLKHEKGKSNESEDKAFEMLKKQEQVIFCFS